MSKLAATLNNLLELAAMNSCDVTGASRQEIYDFPRCEGHLDVCHTDSYNYSCNMATIRSVGWLRATHFKAVSRAVQSRTTKSIHLFSTVSSS